MMKRWLVVASLIVAVVTAACGGDDGGGASAAEDGGVVSVTAVDNEFDPASVNAAAGSTFEITNDGESDHNFSIKGESVDVDIQAGESADVDLPDLDPGTYDFFCKFHEQAGMKGTLEIEG